MMMVSIIMMITTMVVVTLLTIIRSGLRVAMVMLSKTLDLRDNVTCQVVMRRCQIEVQVESGRRPKSKVIF